MEILIIHMMLVRIILFKNNKYLQYLKLAKKLQYEHIY